jgi:hypothetical protein
MDRRQVRESGYSVSLGPGAQTLRIQGKQKWLCHPGEAKSRSLDFARLRQAGSG